MSDYIDRLRQRTGDLLETGVEIPRGEIFAIDHSTWDHQDWDDLVELLPDIEKHIKALWQSHDFVGDFYEDLYNLLIQGSPLLRERDSMKEDRLTTHGVTSGVHDDPSTEGLRLSTMHDAYATAMAMLSMKDRLDEAFRKMEHAQQLNRERMEQREKLRQKLQELADKLAELGQALRKAEDAVGGSGEQQEAAGQANDLIDELSQGDGEAEALMQALGRAIARAEAATEAAKNGAGQELKEGMRQAADEAAAEEDLMRAFGIEDGVLKKMDFGERRKLAQRLRGGRMAQFSRLIGAFRAMQMGEVRRRVIHTPDEVVGVTRSGDLSRLTTSALVDMGTPELEDLFWLGAVTGGLSTYEMRGTERLGRGPIIVVGDESGSMSCGLMSATREAWMKGLALALAQQARDEHRDFIYIGFSSARQVWVKKFPDGVPDLPGVIEIAEHFWSGGPLRVDQRVVTPDGWRPIGNLEEGDQVFAVDGQPVKVLGVHPQGVLQKMYEVEFTDGTVVVCDASHLWTVQECTTREWRTIPVEKMIEMGLKSHATFRFKVPQTKPLDLPHRPDLPIHPYLLGTLISDLRELHYQKFIPRDYLWASMEQRLDLLQGLMDTDGTVGRRGTAEFSSVSEALADGVIHLVQSLGGRAVKKVKQPYGKGRQPCFRVHVSMPVCPFRLTRHVGRWSAPRRSTLRSIRSITPVPAAECVCILVDHPDHLFLTEGMIPTHNTAYEGPLTEALTIVEDYGRRKLPKPDVVFVTDDEYGSMNEDFMKRWKAAKEELDMKCFGIAVAAATSGALAQVSDSVRRIDAMVEDPKHVAEIFRMI